MVSSEENAYGLAGGQWFDGIVNQCERIGGGDLLQINEVTEYKNLNCSKSYYECLAEIFSKFDFSLVKKMFNGSSCVFNNTCFPFSLPFDNDNIPLCTDGAAKHCYLQVLNDLEDSMPDQCQKSCRAEEFKVRYSEFELARK